MEERIIELEKRVSFQQHLLEELNEAAVEQERRLTRLEKELRLLGDRVDKPDIFRKPEEEEPPPHY